MATTLLGPFYQLLPLDQLPERGPIQDESLAIIEQGGILVADGKVVEVGTWETLRKAYPTVALDEVTEKVVAFPGLVDAHTHICFGGSRAMDFAARNGGKSYLEIAKAGGGIWSTVGHTRAASQDELTALTVQRAQRLLQQGVTTVEVKSGYGLSVAEEAKMLRAIQAANQQSPIDMIPTCLAAHLKPKDFEGDAATYLTYILNELVPIIQKEKLAGRFDIFVEQSAFSVTDARPYLQALQAAGFAITIHGDQFSAGGSALAVEIGALSVDHLEASGEKEINLLAKSKVIPVVLPGATIGLGCPWAPARKLLDAGCAVAIASDWNPGSAPHGGLLQQAAIMATFEKLSTAEVFAGMTARAARALGLTDRGTLANGQLADIITFPTDDYREVLYQQGQLGMRDVWKGGVRQD